MPPTYSGQPIVVTDVVFSHPAGGQGVAQAFQYRYEFNTIRLFGLNTPVTFMIFTRPLGTASFVHVVLYGENFNYGRKNNTLISNLGVKGPLTVSSNNFNFTATDAIFVRAEGRITIESFSFNEVAVFVFFNYT
ncbi:MAG: hypothetical protein QXQ37_04085 [Nitrososphaerota archaeon]